MDKTRHISIVGKLALATLLLGGPVSHAYAEDFKQALVSAYKANPRLMAERARVREIDENYIQAQAAGRFNITGDASVGRSLTETEFVSLGGGTISADTWLTPQNGQILIVQPLYQGGRVKGLKAQAKSGILAARQGLRDIEQNILLAAATAYLDVLRDEEAAIIRRNNVRVLSRQKIAAQDRFDVGVGTRTDIAQADSRLAAAEIGLASADAQLAASRAAYVRYIGTIPEQLSVPPRFILPGSLTDAQARARTNNPQIVAARYNENTASSAIDIAKSSSRPTVSINGAIQGSRQSNASVPRSESASITAQLRVPIYSGGANKSRIRAAKQAKIRSKFETRELERVLDQSVANLWAQLDASTRSLAASRKQVESAQIAFNGVELEQQVGTRNTLDVLDAEQELLNAKLSVIQAERNLNVASYQLLATMGGFDAYSLQLPVDLYDPQSNLDIVVDKSSPQNILRRDRLRELPNSVVQSLPVLSKSDTEKSSATLGDPERIDPMPNPSIAQEVSDSP